MSKKNLLISAALTTFVLVVLANVSAVYARIRDTVTLQPSTVAAETLPMQNPAVQVTPQEAANIAAGFLGQNDLYSVENMDWNGVDAYKVVFSSGTIVYVGMDGQILGSQAPQPVLVSLPIQNNNQSQPASVTSFTDNHDDHEEHEDHND